MNDGTITKSTMTAANGATDKASLTAETAKDFAARSKEKLEAVKETAIEVKDKVLDVKDKVVDRSVATLDKVRHYAAANPLKTIAIAFGAGYLAMGLRRLFR